MRRTLLFLFIYIPLGLMAQNRERKQLDPWLEHLLRSSSPEHPLNLFVKGEPEGIRRFCRNGEGVFKFHQAGYASVRIPAGRVKALHGEAFVERIVVQAGKGRALNDTALLRNKILPVHQGEQLPRSYEGKDVIMGYIDSGIDFEHGDFLDSNARTRVMALWDQTLPNGSNTPSKYGYGQEWDSSAINAGNCPHVDQPGYYGHGTSVTSTGSGNGLATGNFKGGAPRSELIIVSNDFGAPNWTASIADAVDYILERADSIGKPVVINTSVGTYSGSHDAKDPAARIIEDLLKEKEGRMLVAAAGNAGHIPFHLGYDVTPDTNFTWFEYDPNSPFGYGAVYFELWADTAEFKNVEYAIGADRVNPNYLFRGRTPFRKIQNGLDSTIADTLLNGNGDTIAIIETHGQRMEDRYKLQVHLKEPDSSDHYFRFITTGNGSFDIWSGDVTGTSPMVDSSMIPDSSQFPDIVNYQPPDRRKTIVSSWTCSGEVLTVGNHVGRTEYVDLNGNTQSISGTTGAISFNSSRGPTRTGKIKPDLTATGKVLMTANKLPFLDQLIQNEPHKVAPDSLHARNGGTSIASPVVASIAALYLEHCPRASHEQVMEALRSTSFSDGFTGSTPNERWGYGKVHGHDALLSATYKPLLNSLGIERCDEPVPVTTQNPYDDYLWSNGDTNYSTGADSTGLYYAMVRDSSGCLGITDSLLLTVHPLPPEPTVFQQGDSLFTDLTGFDYQWYRNGSPIPNATGPGYRIQDSGAFHLEVEDSNGCRNSSDTLHAIPSSLNGMKKMEGLSLSLYPDPVGNEAVLEMNESLGEPLRYRILDLSGRELEEGRIERGSSRKRIDMGDMEAGLYLLQWSMKGQKGSLSFIKE